eukprot:2502295-Amphidinium_carterae.1
MQRADRHRTRPALEHQEFQPGTLVDFWTPPSNKETSGWRGPASVCVFRSESGRSSHAEMARKNSG